MSRAQHGQWSGTWRAGLGITALALLVGSAGCAMDMDDELLEQNSESEARWEREIEGWLLIAAQFQEDCGDGHYDDFENPPDPYLVIDFPDGSQAEVDGDDDDTYRFWTGRVLIGPFSTDQLGDGSSAVSVELSFYDADRGGDDFMGSETLFIDPVGEPWSVRGETWRNRDCDASPPEPGFAYSYDAMWLGNYIPVD